MEENVFNYEDTQMTSTNTFDTVEMESFEDKGGNCHGHFRSMQAGGKGHYVGDSCGCDGGQTPSVGVDFIILPLLLTAFVIISKFKTYGR